MKYENTKKGTFQERKNRFIAHVRIDGKLETVHVKNTGRLGELLTPGAEVVLECAGNPHRKTAYDLVGVYRKSLGWVNIDSQAPNKVVAEWLAGEDDTYVKPEYKYGDSRLDFYMERNGERFLMEVKGCTLEIGGKGYFPDAPSARAVKHIRELSRAVLEGYRCIIAFVIAMEGVTEVLPNVQKDPAFAEALEQAKRAGVEVWYFSCRVTENTLEIKNVKKVGIISTHT